MKRTIPILLAFCAIIACQRKEHTSPTDQEYLRWVGDIAPDPLLDDPDFAPCFEGNAYQYFNMHQGFRYQGEKPALERTFAKDYDATKAKKESGLIRIRFLVNCQGQAGRFRLIGMDEQYQEKSFDASITDQLLAITKNLDGWEAMENRNGPTDYYLYLIFKIKDGAIAEIIP